MTFVKQLMGRLRGWGEPQTSLADDSSLYGVRWENGYIELGYTRALSQLMGGLRHNEVSTTTEWGQVTLVVSEDNGTTWKEAAK